MNAGRGREPAACFAVPAWHRTLWAEQREGNGEAQAVEGIGEDKAAGFARGFVPEVFHRLYAESPAAIPADARAPAAALRARLHDLASELPELDTLRRSTVRSAAWSGIGAVALAEAVAAALPRPSDDPPDADRASRVFDGMRALQAAGSADATAVAGAEGQARGACFAVAEAAADVDPAAIRRALRVACEAAADAIAEAQAACAALGWGDSLETAGAADVATAMQVARTVAGSDKLRAIMALAGRLTATARAKRATRTRYARSETVGVERTGEVSRLLPSELGALGDPLRAADLVRRLGERAALGYAVRGREREAKGPIVVLVDGSGSMRGAREEWSKAVALACLDTARAEGRAFGLATFNAGIVASYLAPDPKRVDPAEVLRVLASSCAGGTAFGPPMDLALGWIRGARETRGALKRADAILITDGCADARGAAERRDAFKREGAHVFGIGIGSEVNGGALAAWADSATQIDDVSADGKAVDLIFDTL